MEITNTFVRISPDCPAVFGMVPQGKKGGKTKPVIEYELLTKNPYAYTLNELIYRVHLEHKEISEEEAANRGTQIWDELFQKPHPCMRASMLPKKYGWGVHYNAEGKIAIYPVDSPEYQSFSQDAGGNVKVENAMRNSRPRAK